MAHAWQRLWLNLWLTGAHKTLRASFPPSAIWWWPINASLTCTPPPCRRSALCTRPLRCAPVPRALFLWLCAFCVKRACNRRSECALRVRFAKRTHAMPRTRAPLNLLPPSPCACMCAWAWVWVCYVRCHVHSSCGNWACHVCSNPRMFPTISSRWPIA